LCAIARNNGLGGRCGAKQQQRKSSGAPEGTCSLSPGRRGLKSGRVEADALVQELFAVDTLGQTSYVAL